MSFFKNFILFCIFSSVSLMRLDAAQPQSKKRKDLSGAGVSSTSQKKNKTSLDLDQKQSKDEKKSLYDLMLTDQERLEIIEIFDYVIRLKKLESKERVSMDELRSSQKLSKLVNLLETLVRELCAREFDGMEPAKLFIDIQDKNNACCWPAFNEIAFGYEKIKLLFNMGNENIIGNKKEQFRKFIWTFCHELGHRYVYLNESRITKALRELKACLIAPLYDDKVVDGYKQRFNELAADECATCACYHLFEDFNPDTDIFYDRQEIQEYEMLIPFYESILNESYSSDYYVVAETSLNLKMKDYQYEPLSDSLHRVGTHLCQKPYELSGLVSLIKNKVKKYKQISHNRQALQITLKTMKLKSMGHYFHETQKDDDSAIFHCGLSHPSHRTRREHAKKIIGGFSK